jgi:threonine dehydrogenase-like Zn-dependent dehydrogenase
MSPGTVVGAGAGTVGFAAATQLKPRTTARATISEFFKERLRAQ